LVLLRKLRYPLVPSYTRIVPGREGFDLFELRWTLQEQISCFGEKFFEPCRRNDFHQPGHFICWIPERVRDSARLQDVLTWARQENFVADSSAELALHYVGILVRVMVEMWWDESSWLDGMLHYGKSSVCFVAGNFQPTLARFSSRLFVGD